jgi:hypothetical protein
MRKHHPVSIPVLAVALVAVGYLWGHPASAQAPGAMCLAMPIVGPGGMDKVAAKGAEHIDTLRAAGKTNIVISTTIICGW